MGTALTPFEQVLRDQQADQTDAWHQEGNKQMAMAPIIDDTCMQSRKKVRVTIKSGMRPDGAYLLAAALRDLAAKDGWELVELAHDEVMISKDIEVTSGNPIMKPCSVEILR